MIHNPQLRRGEVGRWCHWKVISHHLGSQRTCELMGLCSPLTAVPTDRISVILSPGPLCPPLICSHRGQKPERETWKYRGDEEVWIWNTIFNNHFRSVWQAASLSILVFPALAAAQFFTHWRREMQILQQTR